MSDSILVTYATRYGSTQEVAEKIAATLREGGIKVDLKPARQVQTLTGYSAVVLGAPLYIGNWLKDAQRFLTQQQAALEKLPVAIFTLGPTRADEDWTEVRASLDVQLGKYPWLKPVAVELFGGKYDPAKLKFPATLLTMLPASPLYKAPASDARDWDAIHAWASGLVGKL
ncbi:MAG TPA: flavodoxin domain-containing protein [Anaerolineae bacterium]|nr:flavodoxin domain-containing protein [Anaerolineae bacterium]HQI85653.1 flavodoxin domain-containing protein [Anaerolineae bacterium]